MLNISSSRSIIRTGYTTYYMIASYLIISLSLLHIPLVSLSLSLSVCVCLCVNVVVHSLIIIKTKDERRIFSYWPSYVSQCRLTIEGRKKTRRQRTNETGLSFGMQHENKWKTGAKKKKNIQVNTINTMSKRVDGFCTPFNRRKKKKNQKRGARGRDPFFSSSFSSACFFCFPLSHDDIVTTRKKKQKFFSFLSRSNVDLSPGPDLQQNRFSSFSGLSLIIDKKKKTK